MTVDQLCDADIHDDPELRRLIPTFMAILQETENQQVQYRYLSALSRVLGKLRLEEGGGGAVQSASPPHRGLYDPKALLARAVDLLTSPVKEVQQASAQLIGVLLEVLGTLADHALALRILEQLLAMTAERSVHLPTLASQCIAKLVELPSLAREFRAGGRLRARGSSHRAQCVECVARASCAGAPVSQFGEALLRVDGTSDAPYHTAVILNGAWDAGCAGGPRQAVDFRANPQLRLTVDAPTTVTFCLTLNEADTSVKPEKIFMGLDVYAASEEDSFSTSTGRALALDDHVSSPTHLSNFNLLVTVELEPGPAPFIVIMYNNKPGTQASFAMAIISHDAGITVERAERPRYPVFTERLLSRSDGGISSGGGLTITGESIVAGSCVTWRNNPQHFFEVAADQTVSLFVSLTKPPPSTDGAESPGATAKLLVALCRAAPGRGLAEEQKCHRRFVGSVRVFLSF